MPARKAATATQKYRRDEPMRTGLREPLPRTGVRGEVKPHNTAGIRAGVEQLRRSRRPGKPILLTYRTVSEDRPTAFEVLLASPEQLTQALANRRSAAAIDRWYRIGGFTAPQALTPIPFAACPTRFGSSVERSVRNAYARFMRRSYPGFRLDERHPSATGPDILHEELSAYLSELAEQLEAESAGW